MGGPDGRYDLADRRGAFGAARGLADEGVEDLGLEWFGHRVTCRLRWYDQWLSEPMLMDALTAFGALSVAAMLVFYALEERSPWFVLAFAVACLTSSVYGFLQGAWPFGVVELIWSGVALAAGGAAYTYVRDVPGRTGAPQAAPRGRGSDGPAVPGIGTPRGERAALPHAR